MQSETSLDASSNFKTLQEMETVQSLSKTVKKKKLKAIWTELVMGQGKHSEKS